MHFSTLSFHFTVSYDNTSPKNPCGIRTLKTILFVFGCDVHRGARSCELYPLLVTNGIYSNAWALASSRSHLQIWIYSSTHVRVWPLVWTMPRKQRRYLHNQPGLWIGRGHSHFSLDSNPFQVTKIFTVTYENSLPKTFENGLLISICEVARACSYIYWKGYLLLLCLKQCLSIPTKKRIERTQQASTQFCSWLLRKYTRRAITASFELGFRKVLNFSEFFLLR